MNITSNKIINGGYEINIYFAVIGVFFLNYKISDISKFIIILLILGDSG